VANVHAGWRGQVKQIYRITLDKMACVFGTRPEEVLVCISPSLGPDHSEFIHYQEELPTDFLLFQTKPTYFDLWAISQYQLESCGVLPHHIEIAKIDTYAHPDDFFSYRREKATGHTDPITGSHGTVVALCR
jgi:copper oxidase (laccase) domain-containing protein